MLRMNIDMNMTLNCSSVDSLGRSLPLMHTNYMWALCFVAATGSSEFFYSQI